MVEFVGFLIQEKAGELETLRTAQGRLERMRTNLQSRTGWHKAKFQDEDSKIIVTDEDLKLFYSSSRCTYAKTALGSGEELTVREIVNVRNFLIASLVIENSCRPAALYALSKKSIGKASKSPQVTEDGVMFFSVASFYDKNVNASGLPTYLVMSEPLMHHMSVFCKQFHSKLANRNPQHLEDLFLLENGLRMDSEAISNAFRNIV